jgi:hypothetical protein
MSLKALGLGLIGSSTTMSYDPEIYLSNFEPETQYIAALAVSNNNAEVLKKHYVAKEDNIL